MRIDDACDGVVGRNRVGFGMGFFWNPEELKYRHNLKTDIVY